MILFLRKKKKKYLHFDIYIGLAHFLDFGCVFHAQKWEKRKLAQDFPDLTNELVWVRLIKLMPKQVILNGVRAGRVKSVYESIIIYSHAKKILN